LEEAAHTLGEKNPVLCDVGAGSDRSFRIAAMGCSALTFFTPGH
jgi:hypothetical protein